jgi:acetyl esterase/lipase
MCLHLRSLVAASLAVLLLVNQRLAAQEDVADIASQDLRAGQDENKRYFLVGPREGAAAPAKGYGLLVVLPGGDGSADFHPFVKRIYKHAVPEGYLLAQPVAVKWTQEQPIVWPIDKNRAVGMKFSTEEFVDAVIQEVAGKHPLDPERIFTLTWSSSGPAAYAVSLTSQRVTGSFIAMSVFKPDLLPPLEKAKGHGYFLYHSPDDRVCPFRMAEQAAKELETSGAAVKLATYAGGHGWRGNLYGNIRDGIQWLEKNHATPVAVQAGTYPAKVIAKQDVVYGRVHGAGLLADIAYPEAQGPLPAIISVHGGRWVASHKTDPGEGAIDVPQWAGFGFFAMSIDYRLAGGSQPPACYQDLLCAIRWVHAHADEYKIDTQRIFLIGMSAGGHLVSLAATLGDGQFPRTGGWDKESTEIRGVISLSAPYDLEKLSWGGNWAPATEAGMAARRLASPILHVSDKTKPILVLHSDDDGSVPVQQALDMAQALEKAKAPHRLSVYKKQGHMRVTDEVIKETRAFIEEVSK